MRVLPGYEGQYTAPSPQAYTPTPPRYYTYKPGAKNILPTGNAKDQPITKANMVPTLKPGETLGFTSGKGYYVNPAAPAVAQPVKPATPGGEWKMPDYNAIIGGDWELAQAGAEGQKGLADAENSFQAALRRAFIDYGGGDPSKLGEWAKYIDPATIEAAKNNKMSAIAQNLAAMTKNLRRQRAALAARGMLSSGQTTADTKEALTAREAGDYGALRGFLSGAEQGMGSLNSVRQQIADRIAQARANAAARAAEQHQPVWNPGEPAPSSPTSPQQPWGGITWGGTSGIVTQNQMRQVLSKMGVSYATWAKNHPAAAARLK